MQRTLLAAGLTSILFFVVGCGAAREPGRHYEDVGEFSYVPPTGWTVTEFPGLKYKIVAGTPVEEFAPNVNFVDEPFQARSKNTYRST